MPEAMMPVGSRIEAATRGHRPDGPAQRGRALGVIASLSRRQQVADVLREAIISGVLAPDEQLKQDQLCEELGVSPGPLREAMRQLESEGLVAHYPNRGVFVTEVSKEELFGVLLPVRLILERYAVTRTAECLTENVVAELERLVQVMEEGARHGDLRSINEADLRFHELTVTASGAVHATQLWRSVFPRIRAQVYRYAPRHQELAEIPAEHQELLRAIRAGDEAVIAATLEEHIIGTSRLLLEESDRGQSAD